MLSVKLFRLDDIIYLHKILNVFIKWYNVKALYELPALACFDSL